MREDDYLLSYVINDIYSKGKSPKVTLNELNLHNRSFSLKHLNELLNKSIS